MRIVSVLSTLDTPAVLCADIEQQLRNALPDPRPTCSSFLSHPNGWIRLSRS